MQFMSDKYRFPLPLLLLIVLTKLTHPAADTRGGKKIKDICQITYE